MPQNFDPKPGDPVELFEQEYVVQPHPQMPSMAYRQKAGRARVYQLHNEQLGEYFALKEFKKRYRKPSLIDSYRNLHRVEDFEGLRAAERRIVLPDDPTAQRHPNLQYAMLMPWIHGTTWFDVLGQAREDGYYPDLTTAISLCDRFLEVMEGLEANEMAHTDISPGNVMVGFDPIEVQLLDLEDMYMPDADAPLQPHSGSNGYSHHGGETTWKPEGDRYAAAVLAAEMLILANPDLACKATDEGFFTDHSEAPEGAARFEEARRWLEQVAPGFASIFKNSWFADSLEECPSISELRGPIKDLPTRTSAPILLPDTDVVKWERSGAKVERGSSGSILVEVPDLIGQSLPETRSTLTVAGLKLGAKTKAPSEEVPEGRIVNQYPWAGTRAKRGSSVVIMLSSGPEEISTTGERALAHHSQPERAEVSASGSKLQEERTLRPEPELRQAELERQEWWKRKEVLGAVAAAFAGVAWMAFSILAIAQLWTPFVAVVTPLLGTLGGLVGLHTRQLTSYGRLGLAGSLAAFLGIGSLLAISMPGILTVQPGTYGVSLSLVVVVGLLGLLGILVGFVLLGVATLRARVLPRWCGVALIIGWPVALVLTIVLIATGQAPSHFLALFGLTLGFVWLVLGYALWSWRNTTPDRQVQPEQVERSRRWLMAVAAIAFPVVAVLIGPALNTVSGGPIFEDDCSNNSTGWLGKMSKTSGGCGFTKRGGSYAPVGDMEDAKVEVDATRTGDTSKESSWGITCRATDPGHQYLLGIQNDGLPVVRKANGGRPGIISDENTSAKIDPSGINRIRGDCVGDKLTLYVNDQKLVEASDSDLSSGKVGLYSGHSGESRTDVSFDNFSVSKP